MKFALVFLGLAALAAAVHIPVTQKKIADKDFLVKQKAVLELLWKVNYPVTHYKEIVEIAQTYSIEENVDKYTNVEAVKHFVTLYRKGLLPQGQVFTILDEQQEHEAIALFDVFFYAKDWETFYKTACWARFHVNAGQFVYAFTTAIIHRHDLEGIVLPAPYEVYPHYFVNGEVIQKTYDAYAHVPVVGEGEQTVVIPVNNTGLYPYYTYNTQEKPTTSGYQDTYGYQVTGHPEHRLFYFTEDVTLNAYNTYYHWDNPVWMNTTYGYNTKYHGEYFFYFHQQILARYLLERLSNDLFDIHAFDFEEPWTVDYGYNPNLVYPNGQYFPVRPVNVHPEHYQTTYQAQIVKDYVRRIRDAIDLGYVYTKTGEKFPINTEQGIEYLGHIVYSTVASVNEEYYGELYEVTLQLLGHIVDPHNVHHVAPGALEHFETVLRDPAYYNILAGITQLFYKHKGHLPHYQYQDLVFPGVKVNTVDVDKLVTYFENFEFDVSNVIGEQKTGDLVVKASQYRLNHEPFTYKVHVTSDKATKVMVHVFLGPKYDVEGHVLGINEKRKLFVEVDKFPYEVTVGENVIERHYKDIVGTVDDFTTVRTLYKTVVAAIEGKEQFYYDEVDHHCGFPAHLILPKGKRGGQTFTFFVAVTPYVPIEETTEGTTTTTFGCGNGPWFKTDKYPLGYPFDRVIDQTQFFVPNFYEKEVVIFHKKPQDVTPVVSE